MTRILIETEIAGAGEVGITGEEFHYLTRVRRHRQGDTVELRDSAGRRFEAVVASLGREEATLSVGRELGAAPDALPLTVVMAVPKRQIMDDVVRKLNELGAGRIIPVVTDRSVVEPADARIERWRRIASESVRQCGRREPLEIEEPRRLDSVLDAHEDVGCALILHPGRGGKSLADLASEGLPAPVVLLVGPEGGFTDPEVDRAVARGFQVIEMGRLVLRTETAAIAACAVSVLFCSENEAPG